MMSVYKNENPAYFSQAMDSMLSQTVPPSEIVLVEDGPLTDSLYKVIDRYVSKNEIIKIVPLKENVGLGKALLVGSDACTYEYIARMDTDDYSSPNRMELTLSEFDKDSELMMVGTQIAEFVTDYTEPITMTNLPLEHKDILKYSKRRDPFRHPAITIKRKALYGAGNYNGDILYFEDWDLFNRVLSSGYKTKNIPEVCVYVRVSPDFYARRGGARYLKSVIRFKVGEYRRGYFTFSDMVISLVPHVIVGVAPNWLRALIYKKFLRK